LHYIPSKHGTDRGSLPSSVLLRSTKSTGRRQRRRVSRRVAIDAYWCRRNIGATSGTACKHTALYVCELVNYVRFERMILIINQTSFFISSLFYCNSEK